MNLWLDVARENRVATLLKLPGGARKRVHVTKFVEERALDAMFGESLQLKVARGIEAIHGTDQTDGSGGDEVVEFDLMWTTAMKPAGE